MNEMKPEDVMRALECCRDNDVEDTCEYCKECPANYVRLFTEEGDCLYDVYTAAIEMIRKMKSTLEQWEADFNTYESMLYSKDAEIEKQKALKKIATDNNHQCYGLGYEDGITEFAERLTGRFNLCPHAMYSESTVHEVIAHIAKEMKEKYNERDNA